MKNRKYLYVTPFFPSPKSWRGAFGYDFVVALRKVLAERMQVEVFVPGTGTDYEIGDVRVRVFPVRHLPSCVFPFLFRKFNQRSFLKAVERAGIELVDVAYCHGNSAEFSVYPAAIKAKNPNCRAILHHHDLGSFGLQSGRLRHCWLYNLIEFPILRHWHEKMDLHVFISEMCKRSFLSAPDAGWTSFPAYRKQMRGLPWRSVRIRDSYVLYNGVDTSLFKPGNQKNKQSNALTIGCIGNFNPSKGQLMLLRAVEKLNFKGVKVVFVGSGPELEQCKKYAKDHRLSTEFRHEVRHERLPAFYQSLDLFVLPSVWDGFGCVYTEAWACGVPFITTEGAGVRELIAEPEKWVAKIDDIDDLAVKIGDFFENRWPQCLTFPADIDTLMRKYVAYLDHG